MNYKAYKQEPHSAMLEIKKAFDEEKPYKAQSICLAYFSYLENQRHIDRALDYAGKDDVYKYVLKHMGGEIGNLNKVNEYIEEYKEKLEEVRQQSLEYTAAAGALEKFCIENNFDLDALIEKYLKKSKEELIESNKAVSERQKNKITKSKNVASMPGEEEYQKLMQESADYNLKMLGESIEKRIESP